MTLTDGKRRIRQLWGGYSPKVFDGHFLQDNKYWFETQLQGSVVVADQHFEYGKKNFEGLHFHTPWKTPSTGKRKAGAKGSSTLSADK